MSPKLIIKNCLWSLLLLGFTFCASAQSEKANAKEVPSTRTAETGYVKKSGDIPITYAGVDILTGPETTTVRFRVIAGFSFNPKFSAGLGTGFTFYHDPLSLVPLFLNAQYRFSEGNISPFASLNLGYSISILSDTDSYVEKHHGGYLLNPAIGLEFETMSGFNWHISAGYNIDNSQFSREGFNGRIIETDITYRRFMAGIGFSF